MEADNPVIAVCGPSGRCLAKRCWLPLSRTTAAYPVLTHMETCIDHNRQTQSYVHILHL